MLLQGTPFIHRMLLYCRGYHIYCQDTTFTAGIPHLLPGYHIYCKCRGYHSYCSGYCIYCRGYHIYCSNTTFTAGIPHLLPRNLYVNAIAPNMFCCSRLLHCSIGCYTTAWEYHIYCRGYHIYTPADTTLLQVLFVDGIERTMIQICFVEQNLILSLANTFCRRN